MNDIKMYLLIISVIFFIKDDVFPEIAKTNNLSGESEKILSIRPENFTEGVWIKKYAKNYACFKFETPDGIKIVCDPYNMYETVSADIVTESHQDPDHIDTSKITGLFRIYKQPGDFEEKGIRFAGIIGWHNKNDTKETNIIFIFEINGIKIAHFASQGCIPDENMWVKIKEFNGIDILLIQACDFQNHVKLMLDECFIIIDRLKPKIVIPEHGTVNIGKDFAKHYNTCVEYINYNGFIVTKDFLKRITAIKIIDMDNKGPDN